jgi:hypothetical protein
MHPATMSDFEFVTVSILRKIERQGVGFRGFRV